MIVSRPLSSTAAQAQSNGPKEVSSWFKGYKGVQLHYLTVSPTTNPDRTKRLIIVPGRTEPAEKYLKIAKHLKSLGMKIFILDLRGQGQSERLINDPVRGHVHNFDDYIEDLNQFVTHLNKAEGPAQVYMIGHSMGGLIAKLFDSSYPGVVKALALSAPMFSINTGGLSEEFTLRLARWLERLGMAHFYVPGCGAGRPESSTFDGNNLTGCTQTFESERQRLIRKPHLYLGGPTVRWFKTAVLASQSLKQQDLSSEAPTLVISADADTVVRPEAHQSYRNKARKGFLLKVLGAKHEILFEKKHIRNKAISAILLFFRSTSDAAKPKEMKRVKSFH